MKKRTICLLSILFSLCVTVAWASDAHRIQADLAQKMVRLHILANSDSEEDQALKLEVRDAVLARTEKILQQSDDLDEAERKLTAFLDELAGIGQQIAEMHGYDYPVTAELKWEYYPTREYESFTLPAGRYLSLRIFIGEGEGRNWWCVVFPPLCTAITTEDFTASAEGAGLTSEELSLITQESGGYVVRFKVIELVESFLKNWE